VNVIGNADEELEMIVDQQNNPVLSENNNQILEFSPPKQNEGPIRRNSPVKTPRKKRKGVQGFVDGLNTNKSTK
jgi:hypothetical protein